MIADYLTEIGAFYDPCASLFEASFPSAPIYQLYQTGHFLYED